MSRLDYPWDYNRTMNLFPILLRVFYTKCENMNVSFEILDRKTFKSLNQTELICTDEFSKTGINGVDVHDFIEYRVKNETQFKLYDFLTSKSDKERQNFFFQMKSTLT